MNSNYSLKKIFLSLLGGASIAALTVSTAAAQSIDDTIVVTAQRTEQSLQDVPISVSAFSGDDLQARQLEAFEDIRFNVPNFSFSRSQFTNSNVAIRGVGNFIVAASSEGAVSTHMNDVFVASPRLFETEFFDMERLEILRGPQGTLYGRNATAGVMNVITAKADPDAVGGYADAEFGNYGSVKVNGALNLPLSETLAVRVAGTTINRDGYTENIFTNTDIDDRSIYALRGSVRWYPTENTTVDFIANHMREDDKRARFQKTACEQGPLSPVVSCDPSGPRRFESGDLRGTIFALTSAETFALITGNPAAGAYGLFSLANPPADDVVQPADFRQVAQDTNPKYDAEETILQLHVKHDFDNWSVKLNGGYGNSEIATTTDADGGVGPTLTVPAVLGAPVAFGGLPGVFALYSDGQFPISAFDVGLQGATDGRVGLIGGFEQSRSQNNQSIDLSIGDTEYWSAEAIVNTDFDGPLNFLIGGNHLETRGFANYGVASTSLDYFSIVAGTLTAAGIGIPDAATTGYSYYVPYFYNDTIENRLDSTSIFGEVYFDISDTLSFTGGIRRNWDTKGITDRGNLFDSFIALSSGTLPPGVTPVVPLGTQSVLGLLDPNPLTSGTPGAVADYRNVESDFNSLTGRAVLQWTPSDNAQIYASWTRGFKSGGFNPLTTSTTIPLTFEPEVINAYEVGLKSNLLDGSLQANLTGFYYDYSGLQVSRIVNRAAIAENINAKIFGLEGEFVWRPTDRFTANMTAAYLNTDIGEFSTFNPQDPSAGRTDVEVIADITTGANCVVTRGAGDNPLLLSNGGTPFAGPFAGLNAIVASPFSICNELTNNLGVINFATGGNYNVVEGIEQSVEGNDLLGAPDFQISGGIQYEFPVGANHTLTPRVDAYYQTEFYTSIFNTQQDQIDGYAYLNAQVNFAPNDGIWYVRAFIQNLTDSDAITGAYNADQTSGGFQNLFLLEPRRYGVGIGLRF